MATIEYLNQDTDELYSDGEEIELDILNYAKTVPQNRIRTLFEKDCRWAVFYHLSDMRENILSWYDFKPGCEVLEIGGGMGAITGLLCRKAGSVTTVELTKRRASVIYARHKDCENLRILVGNFNDMDFSKKYDYITLIGVLEYAKGFVASGRAEDFLTKIKSLLKPGGKLLIAIENRFGLKYWCGASEDHLSRPFVGINGYPGENRIETYSRSDLAALLKRCGFPKMRFSYPLPDYKFPQAIYTDEFQPGSSSSKELAFYYIATEKLIADEAKCFRAAVENGAFPFMANSFFVECAAESTAEMSDVIFSSFTPERSAEHRTVTKIRAGRTVEKLAACPEAAAHLEEILKGQKRFAGDALIGYRRAGDRLEMPFIEGESLNTALCKALQTGDINAAKSLFDALYDCILASAGALPDAELLPCGFLDMTASNCFIADGKLRFFDQEWRQEQVSPRFILYRAIHYFFAEHPEITAASEETFFELYHYSSDARTAFEADEKTFQQSVCPMEQNPLITLWGYRAAVNENGELVNRRLEDLQQAYDTISNATLWKISAPLRRVLDKIKMRKQKKQAGKR